MEVKESGSLALVDLDRWGYVGITLKFNAVKIFEIVALSILSSRIVNIKLLVFCTYYHINIGATCEGNDYHTTITTQLPHKYHINTGATCEGNGKHGDCNFGFSKQGGGGQRDWG